MRLHEEFKLYEELWEATEESTLETSGTTDSYIRGIGKQKYDLLDKDDFKEYLKKRFYMRAEGSKGRYYYGAQLLTMDYYISQLEWVIKKIMTSIEVDKKKGLLDDTMVAKIKSYSDDIVQEYKRLRDSSDFMIVYEKDGSYKYKYELKFFDIGDPLKAYEFLQQYPNATEAVYNLLRQNNRQDVIFKLTAMKHNAKIGKPLVPPAKSKYYRDNGKYKKNTTGTTTGSSNNSTDNPDEYTEYDSFFEEFKE